MTEHVTWSDVAKRSAQLVVSTVCVVVVLLVTAQNPSRDEFTRGAPAGVGGAAVAFLVGRMFGNKDKQ